MDTSTEWAGVSLWSICRLTLHVVQFCIYLSHCITSFLLYLVTIYLVQMRRHVWHRCGRDGIEAGPWAFPQCINEQGDHWLSKIRRIVISVAHWNVLPWLSSMSTLPLTAHERSSVKYKKISRLKKYQMIKWSNMIKPYQAKGLDEAATAAAAAVRVEAEASELPVTAAYRSCHLDALRCHRNF